MAETVTKVVVMIARPLCKVYKLRRRPREQLAANAFHHWFEKPPKIPLGKVMESKTYQYI